MYKWEKVKQKQPKSRSRDSFVYPNIPQMESQRKSFKRSTVKSLGIDAQGGSEKWRDWELN